MVNCEILFPYGLAVIIIAGCSILIPFLRGKTDLISAWNFLLVGVAIFIGIGCLEAATSPLRFPGLDWFEPTKAQVQTYLMSTTAFLIVLFLSHHYDRLGPAFAARVFNRWPPITPAVLLTGTAICMVLALAAQVPMLRSVTFIGPLISNISHKAMLFATLFSFLLWYRNRVNIVWLALFLSIFLSMCVLAMVVGSGRRQLLTTLTVPIVAIYFFQVRNWRPTRALFVMSLGTLALFCASLMYSSFRHFDRRGEKLERNAANVLKTVSQVHKRHWMQGFMNDKLWYFSQQVVHYGMLTDHFVSTGQLEPKPFNTFKFIAVYPIPRNVWKGKPLSLGKVITHRVLGRTTSWGTGVAGHAVYEGGMIIAALFGYFAAFGVRFFDDPMRRQPTNPFLIGMLAAASIQIVAWPRGDLAVMTFEVAECLFFVIAFSFILRFLYGTDRSWLTAGMGMLRGRAVYPASAR